MTRSHAHAPYKPPELEPIQRDLRLPWHEEHIEADHVFFCPSVRHIPIAYLGVAPRARVSNGLADYLYPTPHRSTRRQSVALWAAFYC